MKTTLFAVIVGASLVGCAATGSAGRAEARVAGGKLPPGAYQFTSYDSAGAKVAGPMRIDIPFNDQSFAVGAMCGNDRAARVVAKGASGQDAASFECARRPVK